MTINQYLYEPINWVDISPKNAETIRHLMMYEAYDSKTFIAKMLNNEIPIWVLLTHKCIIENKGEYKFVFSISKEKEKEIGKYIASILQCAIDSNNSSLIKKIVSNFKISTIKKKSRITRDLQKQKEKLYKIISDEMNWKYEKVNDDIIFSDMKKFKKQAVL